MDHTYDYKTLADANIFDKKHIYVIDSTNYNSAFDAPLPLVDDSVKLEKIDNVRMLFEDFDKDLIALALERSDWNPDEAVNLLMDDFMKSSLEETLR